MISSPPSPLPRSEYEAIYAKIPRLTVEVIIVSSDGVLLTRRRTGPCAGLWHIPGGTVHFGEPLTDAVQRVAEQELGAEVTIDDLLGYIEYPSHLARGLDWPVGIAFRAQLTLSSADQFRSTPDAVAWFATLPEEMHDEQKVFLSTHDLEG
jgi:ADP-ribose pyrophosphatase YjhB (NUDIX family)